MKQHQKRLHKKADSEKHTVCLFIGALLSVLEIFSYGGAAKGGTFFNGEYIIYWGE